MRRKLSRREIDRLENLLILLLVCLALFLIHRTGMFQSVTEQGSGTGDESLFAGVQGYRPVPGNPGALDGAERNRTLWGAVRSDNGEPAVPRWAERPADPVSGHHGFPPGQLPGGMGARGEPGEQLGVL